VRAVIYARDSTEMHRQASIEDQVEVCRRYALAQGWTVVDRYEDAAISEPDTPRLSKAAP
jgi:site-specific DNA recombinase